MIRSLVNVLPDPRAGDGSALFQAFAHPFGTNYYAEIIAYTNTGTRGSLAPSKVGGHEIKFIGFERYWDNAQKQNITYEYFNLSVMGNVLAALADKSLYLDGAEVAISSAEDSGYWGGYTCCPWRCFASQCGGARLTPRLRATMFWFPAGLWR